MVQKLGDLLRKNKLSKKGERKLVYDPLRKSHKAFDKAVKDAKGDLKKLKDAIKLHPKLKASQKTNSVNAQCYVAARTVHRPCHLYIFNFLMNDTEVIALQPPLEYTMNENAEVQNGRWAMIGIISALGAYATTGQIIPGIF